jgi:DNA-binding response OmpR family regulator
MRHDRITIVDDDKDFAESLGEALAGKDREITVYADGLAMLTALDKPADLLITDLMMPWVNGTALVKNAYLLHPHTEVLVVSAYKQCAEKMAELGLNTRYLQKPFGLDEVRREVAEALERVHADRSA